MKTFYMVYVENQSSPTVQHSTLEIAENEAKRLSKLLNRKVFILTTLKSVEINEFLIKDLRPSDELPF